MFIEIDDGTNDMVNMDIEEQMLELYPWVTLNIQEIGSNIAANLFYAEYDITQEILDEEINDYLSHIHERIIEQAIQKLEENNVTVF